MQFKSGCEPKCGMPIIILWGIQGMLDQHPEWTADERLEFIKTVLKLKETE